MDREAPGLRLVSRWIEARNAFDLDGMLALTTEDVEFHPLRLLGDNDIYVGHESMRQWFSEVRDRGLHHQLRVSEIRENGENEILVIGTVDLPGSPPVADFFGIFEISGGLIARVHHYMSDRRSMVALGLMRVD